MNSRIRNTSKLKLNKETLRTLSLSGLAQVRGGVDGDTHSDIITDILRKLTILDSGDAGSNQRCYT
jgi:hypothetical protein